MLACLLGQILEKQHLSIAPGCCAQRERTDTPSLRGYDYKQPQLLKNRTCLLVRAPKLGSKTGLESPRNLVLVELGVHLRDILDVVCDTNQPASQRCGKRKQSGARLTFMREHERRIVFPFLDDV